MSIRQICMLSFLATLLAGPTSNRSKTRVLAAEPLETRSMLSATGLVEVGSQPDGALSDKIVYLHGGHGLVSNGSSWGYQRPLLLGMAEDLGNQDQTTFFANHLWDAGATVVPLRPIGHQVNEAVLDNDDVGVSFDGAWGNGSGSVYFGDAGDVRYRFATTSATETAVATYRPNLTEAGFYPVYTWSPAGANRATDQLYRVHHSGGATEVTIDHSRVGNGVVYLGTYHFDEGTDGAVEISNRSSEPGKVVVADMIRFGNGMGDINLGFGVSGEPRENEAGLYWVQWHVDRSQGIPTSEYRTTTSDRNAAVSFSPRYAEYMNQEGVGTLSDRVFVSFHSNAGGGGARGVLGLLNGNNQASAATPNQLLLAESLAQEVNDDLVAQNGSFEHDWFGRSVVTLDRSDIEFGEINNQRIGNEFDATIIETGFHDNSRDAEMLRDQRVRDAIARSTYHGLVDYFGTLDGTTPDIDAPPRVTALSGETTAPGQVTLSWSPGSATSFSGDAADGYMVYASKNGLGFDGGTFIPGGGTTAHTITDLNAGETYYFRVAAVNAGGEAPDSEVVAVKPSAAAEKLLIVNGFDRLDRSSTPSEPFRGGPNTVDRVRVRGGNTFDYAIQVATAIEDAGATPSISTVSNEAVANGTVDLADYDAVIWIAGEESTVDDTFNGAEQIAVADYLLTHGGKLFVSGSEIAWDLDNQNNGRSFFNSALRADYVADDAGTYNATGVAGGIFEDLNLVFDDGSEVYNVDFPDVISPRGGATSALTYGGGGGSAGIQYTDAANGQQLVMLGFPFETLVGDGNQVDVMTNVLDYFGFATSPIQNASVILDNDDGPSVYTETGNWITASDPGVNGGTQRFNLIGSTATATWTGTLPLTGDAEVFVQYDAAPNRATGVRYHVTVGGETRTVTLNQRENDFSWVSLGTFDDVSGSVSVTVDVTNSTGVDFALVIADAVRLDVRGQAEVPNGDFNEDGLVNAADYTLYRDTLGQVVTPLTGADADGSGMVDEADYDIWTATYGQVITPAPAIALATASPADPTPSEAPYLHDLSFILPTSPQRDAAFATLPAPASMPADSSSDEASLLLAFAEIGAERSHSDGEPQSLISSHEETADPDQAAQEISDLGVSGVISRLGYSL